MQPSSASEEKRYEGVVASAVMRAMFPKDVARRAFLKSVGASTALAALSQFFPLGTATDLFAQGGAARKEGPQGRLHPDHLRDPDHHGASDGLLFEARPQRRSGQDRRLGGGPRQDHQQGIRRRAHAVADADRDLAWALGSNPIPFTVPAVENINGQAITLAIKHKDKRDPKSWKGMKFAVPFDYSMHNYLLRYYLAEHGLDPDHDVQIRSVPPPEMVANLRADNIDGFLAPDNSVNQRAVYDGVGFIHLLSKEDLGRASLLRLRGEPKEFITQVAEHLCGAAPRDHRRHRLFVEGRRTARRSPRRSRPRTISMRR